MDVFRNCLIVFEVLPTYPRHWSQPPSKMFYSNIFGSGRLDVLRSVGRASAGRIGVGAGDAICPPPMPLAVHGHPLSVWVYGPFPLCKWSLVVQCKRL